MVNVLVYGASGHGKVVVDILENSPECNVLSYVDDNSEIIGSKFYGYSVMAGGAGLSSDMLNCNNIIIAIGDNRIRGQIYRSLVARHFDLVKAVHPDACLARDVIISDGVTIMSGAVINSSSHVGACTIVNTNASIDHDCVIDECVHIAPGATLCGGVHIGEGTLIGAGATVIPGINVGRHCIVGAGSTVIENVPDSVNVYGSPAR